MLGYLGLMAQASVVVVGATGYGGAEIVRLLARHPCAKVTAVTSRRNAGTPLAEECPWLATDLVLSEFDPDSLKADLVFLAQEAGFAMKHARSLIKRTRVIDLSADFRLDDRSLYPQFYKTEHSDPSLQAVYGLPELVDRTAISEASLIALPGCYPTASLLGLMPLVRAGLVDGIPVIDAKSGTSGAGRSRQETEYLFSELDGGFRAYAVNGHRHTPEIEQLSNLRVRFTPHLVPMPRGIHATLHVPIKGEPDLQSIYRDFYRSERFVSVVGHKPSTKEVLGSNRCVINVEHDKRLGYAVVCSVIDNMVKGVAGQALQNMNLMLGFPEETGLPVDGIWP